MVVVGTLGPFLLNLTALCHLPAARVGVVATLEPPLAAIVAWIVHGEALTGVQNRGRADGGRRRGVGSKPPALPRSEAVPGWLKAAPVQAE